MRGFGGLSSFKKFLSAFKFKNDSTVLTRAVLLLSHFYFFVPGVSQLAETQRVKDYGQKVADWKKFSKLARL